MSTPQHSPIPRVAARALTALVLALTVLTGLGTTVAAEAAPGSAAKKGNQSRVTTIPNPNPAADAQADLAEYGNRVMAGINQQRAAAGLAPIARYDTCLERVSTVWAQRLSRAANLYHRDQRSVLKKCRLSWAGENLLRGVGVTPEESVTAWMNSPAHRDIILTKRATLAGITFRVDSSGRYVGVLNLGDN